MATNPKDLTRPESIGNAHPDDEGTAIYWLRDRDQNDNYEQLFVPGVTHQRADEMANEFDRLDRWNLDGYRWVPDQVEGIDSLVTARCGGRCRNDLDCVNNACRCINGRCRRK